MHETPAATTDMAVLEGGERGADHCACRAVSRIMRARNARRNVKVRDKMRVSESPQSKNAVW
jgi:hypothetical protein